MNDTASKLSKILETKAAIKQAIINKGVEVPDDAVFADYPAKISAIETGGGSVETNPYQQLYMQRTANETSMVGLLAYTPVTTTLDLSMMNTSKVTEMTRMFDNCKAPYLDLSGFDVSNVIDMSYMFAYCFSNVNVDGWDTSGVVGTNYMFDHFNGSIDLSKLDFSKVTNANYMFNYAKINNINLTGLNFPSTNSLGYLFYYAEGDLLDLSSWDISNITTMSNMFNSAKLKKIDLTGWKTTNVTDMGNMFQSYSNDLVELIIPDWDMTNTTKYSSFFNSGSSYTKALMLIDLSRSNDTTITKITSTLPTRTITTFGKIMIPSESSQDVVDALIAKYWKPVGPRLDMTSCEIAIELDEIKPGKSTKFYYNNQEPWYGDDANVEYISSDESVATVNKETMMVTSTGIEGTTEITARIVDTQEVISVAPITLSVSETDNYPNVIKFRGTSTPKNTYNYIYVNGTSSSSNKVLLSTMNYNSVSGIYTYDVGEPITYVKFNGYGDQTNAVDTCTDLVKINTSNMTSMERMFSYCSKLTSLDLSSFNTSNVTNMENMFISCSNLTSLDLSSFNTSNVTTMYQMFHNCQNLTSLDLSSFNTSNVTTMNSMFSDCDDLTSLDLSGFNTSNVTDMQYMFRHCNNLIEVDANNWDMSKIHSLENMFQYCERLESLNLSNWDLSKITNKYAYRSIFNECLKLHTIRLDNCNNTTISRLITSSYFPTNAIEGVTRKIYCKESETEGLTPPENWVFEYVVDEPETPEILTPYVVATFNTNESVGIMGEPEGYWLTSYDEGTTWEEYSNETRGNEIVYLKPEDVSGIKIYRLFEDCSYLTSAEFFNFSNASFEPYSDFMFSNCFSLESLDLGGLDISGFANVEGMLNNCNSLKELRLEYCNDDTVRKIITSELFPTGIIPGVTRKIYVSRFLDSNITAPDGWVFALV